MSETKSLIELIKCSPIHGCRDDKISEELWVGSLSFARIQISGLLQGRICVEGTMDGINWYPITMVSHDNIAASHAQFDGIYGCHISCLDKIRVKVYDYVSSLPGGINVTIKSTHGSSIAYVIAT